MLSISEFDLVVAIVAVWMLLAVVCVYDYNRYDRDAFGYLLAMFSLPIVGIVVSIVYLLRRNEFATLDVWKPELSIIASDSGCTVQTTDDRVLWNCQLPGRENLRRRLLYVFASKPRVGAVFFIGILVFGAAVTDLQREPLVFVLCGFLLVFKILDYLTDSILFKNVTVGVNQHTGVLGWNRHETDNQLFPGHRFVSSYTSKIELESVETVELLRVDQQYLARLSYPYRAPGAPKRLPIPEAQVAWFSKTLTNHGVELQDRTDDDSNDEIISQRLYAGAAELVAVPLFAVIVWFGWLPF